jgi:Pregnancy-associated plasma protein-A
MQAAEGTVPPRRACGTMEVHHRLLEAEPTYRARQSELEQHTVSWLERAEFLRPGVTRIPVVVHVVYNAQQDNISDQQIASQIDALNKDYRATNPDRAKVPPVWAGLVTDVRIEFFLADHNPTGQATNGITRTQTQATSFSTHDEVKSAAKGGVDPWPADRFLNIWVCRLGGGLLGYAQFPGGPAATDGVVILTSAFGTTGTATAPFNLGRSATHEVGHWLNLHHIWADTSDCSGTDFCADTPTQQAPNFNKPTFPHISCTNGPNGDMFMNYMDYVDDDTMVMFTTQQVARMQAALDGARSSIGT